MSMILNPKTVDEAVPNFFINTLPSISRDTDYKSLNEMIQALYSNAVTLPRTISGGKAGNVEIIIQDTINAILAMGTPLGGIGKFSCKTYCSYKCQSHTHPTGQRYIRQSMPIFSKTLQLWASPSSNI